MTTQTLPGWAGYAYSRMRPTGNQYRAGQPVSGGGFRPNSPMTSGAAASMGPQTSGTGISIEPDPLPGNDIGAGSGGGAGGGSFGSFLPLNPFGDPYGIPRQFLPLNQGGGGSLPSNSTGPSSFFGSGYSTVYPTFLGASGYPHAQPVAGNWTPTTGYSPFGGAVSSGSGFAPSFGAALSGGAYSGMSYADARAAQAQAAAGGGPANLQKRKF